MDSHTDSDPLVGDLDDYLTGPVADLFAAPPPAVEREADMLLRRRARTVAELARIEALAAAERARIDEWVDDRSYGPRRLADHLDSQLEAYARAVWRDNPKRMTHKLPHGTLRLTAGRASVIVDDEAALIEWWTQREPDPSMGAVVERVETWKVHKSELTRLARAAMSAEEAALPDDAEPGPPLNLEYVVVDGEIVPGVHVETPAEPKFQPPKENQ